MWRWQCWSGLLGAARTSLELPGSRDLPLSASWASGSPGVTIMSGFILLKVAWWFHVLLKMKLKYSLWLWWDGSLPSPTSWLMPASIGFLSNQQIPGSFLNCVPALFSASPPAFPVSLSSEALPDQAVKNTFTLCRKYRDPLSVYL